MANFPQNSHFQTCRQGSPRFKGAPRVGWDELEPNWSYLSHFPTWYSKSGHFPIKNENWPLTPSYGSIILKIVLWAHFSITHAVLIGSSDFLKNPYFRTGYCATAYVLSVHSLVWIPNVHRCGKAVANSWGSAQGWLYAIPIARPLYVGEQWGKEDKGAVACSASSQKQTSPLLPRKSGRNCQLLSWMISLSWSGMIISSSELKKVKFGKN